jgi:hypothetical protein
LSVSNSRATLPLRKTNSSLEPSFLVFPCANAAPAVRTES